MTSKSDIQTRDDIDIVVARFYKSAIQDAVIGHFFTTVHALDLTRHLPVIGNFWETILFGRPVYSGNPMRVHLQLDTLSPLEGVHFQRWLQLWSESIDGQYAGPTAQTMKDRAHMVARSISMRLEDLRGDSISPR